MTRKIGALFLILLATGFVFIEVAYLRLTQVDLLDRASEVARHQKEISQALAESLGYRPWAREGQKRVPLPDITAQFDASFAELDQDLQGNNRPLPACSREAFEQVAELRHLWDKIREPLTSLSDGSDSQIARAHQTLQIRVPKLVALSDDVAATFESRRQELREETRWTLLAGFGCYLVVLGFSLWFTWCRVIRPVRSLARAAQYPDTGAIRHRTSDTKGDELRFVTEVMSGMGTMLKTSLERQHRSFEEMVATIPFPLLVLSSKLRILCASHTFLKSFAYASEDLLGYAIHEIFPAAAVRDNARTALNRGTPEVVTLNIPDERGTRLLRFSFTEIGNWQGQETCVLVGVEDLTEIESFRIAQEQLGQRYEKLIQNTTEAVLILRGNGRIAEFSRAAERMFGWMEHEVLGRPVTCLFPEPFGTRPADLLGQLLAGGQPNPEGHAVELDAVRKTGKRFPVRFALSGYSVGADKFYAVNVSDLTKPKRVDLLERDCLEVLEIIPQARPMDSVLAALARMVERQNPDALCMVSLLRDQQLYPIAAPSLPEGYVEAITGMEIGPMAGASGMAAYSNKVVIADDLASDVFSAEQRELARSHGLHACWALPIYSNYGRILGTLATYYAEPRKPDRGELDLLEMASRLAAVAIEQRRLTEELAYHAQHDALTGLPNRLLLADRLEQAIAQAKRKRCSAGLLFVDLDRFKLINDTLGHAIGDGLLQQVAQRLTGCVRQTDTVARNGGDEFMVVLSELKSADDAEPLVDKLLQTLRAPIMVDGHELFVSASVGISVFPQDGQDAATLLKNADSAMYKAKSQGKDGYRRFTPEISATACEQLDLETQLRGSLSRGELSLQYQPQFELETGRVVGMEALLRWVHPKLGIVEPSKFISIAEESGMIVQIGEWVIEQACHQIRAWQQSTNTPLRVAVNVSSVQFAREDFVEVVAKALQKSGLDPRCLELELTESMVMHDIEHSAPRMAKLKALGVRLALDDFGTGHSSLSYLQRLPIDHLKIDQSFVREITAVSSIPPLLKSIIGIATSLRMLVTAEGVENECQKTVLKRAGCHQAQGYLLSVPLTADNIQKRAWVWSMQPLPDIQPGSTAANDVFSAGEFDPSVFVGRLQ